MKKMGKDTNTINWFEIPVTDMERAKKFYETAFDVEMMRHDMGGMEMTMFPSEEKSGLTSGALVKSQMHKPSKEGAILYMNANPDLQLVLDRVKTAGGTVIMEKTQITPEIGYMAFFADSEGNSVGLHSQG
jgi:uncharacterized protein